MRVTIRNFTSLGDGWLAEIVGAVWPEGLEGRIGLVFLQGPEHRMKFHTPQQALAFITNPTAGEPVDPLITVGLREAANYPCAIQLGDGRQVGLNSRQEVALYFLATGLMRALQWQQGRAGDEVEAANWGIAKLDEFRSHKLPVATAIDRRTP